MIKLLILYYQGNSLEKNIGHLIPFIAKMSHTFYSVFGCKPIIIMLRIKILKPFLPIPQGTTVAERSPEIILDGTGEPLRREDEHLIFTSNPDIKEVCGRASVVLLVEPGGMLD